MLNFVNDCIYGDKNIPRNQKIIENVNNNNNVNSINNNVIPLENNYETISNEFNNSNKTINPNRRHNNNSISRKCPEFMQNYCMCLFRKIEPIDRNSKAELKNGTPIIPVALDSDVYVSHYNFVLSHFRLRRTHANE